MNKKTRLKTNPLSKTIIHLLSSENWQKLLVKKHFLHTDAETVLDMLPSGVFAHKKLVTEISYLQSIRKLKEKKILLFNLQLTDLALTEVLNLKLKIECNKKSVKRL